MVVGAPFLFLLPAVVVVITTKPPLHNPGDCAVSGLSLRAACFLTVVGVKHEGGCQQAMTMMAVMLLTQWTTMVMMVTLKKRRVMKLTFT